MLIIYSLYSAYRGEIHAKQGLHMTLVTRTDSPVYFWVVIACYVLVGTMILFIPA